MNLRLPACVIAALALLAAPAPAAPLAEPALAAVAALPPEAASKGEVLLREAKALRWGQRWFEAISRLARAASLEALQGEVPRGAAQAGVDEATVVIPLAGLIDLAAERARLQKERGKAVAEAEKVQAKLANPDFVARAKEEVVEENRDRLAAARTEIARLDAALARIA